MGLQDWNDGMWSHLKRTKSLVRSPVAVLGLTAVSTARVLLKELKKAIVQQELPWVEVLL